MAEDEEPGDYIEQRKDIHDCFFLVGTEKKERISTVKYFLANYSSYFRAMLLETDMKEKKSKEDIVIPDHEPDVFRLMLSFVYGRHDIRFKDVNQAMRFHILVDRCLMPKLKKISTKYLMENCKSNLCEVLECAVLLDIKEMEPRAKTIVEKDTRALLSSPDFLNAHPAVVEFIVKQEGLNVTEVELWCALVKWAKRQCGNTREGSSLQKKIGSFIKHVQFLKMTLKEFAEEVVPTSILTPSETIAIFVNMATGKGNTIKEAPSRARHEWLFPEPRTCVVSFPLRGCFPRNYTTWECEYEIRNINTTKLGISFITLASNCNSGYIPDYGEISYGVYIKLFNINENRLVTEEWHDLNRINNGGILQQPATFKLPDDWIMEASKCYRLSVRFDNNDNALPPRARNLRSNPEYVKSCNFCSVELIYSLFQNSRLVNSIVESLTFSVIDP